MALPHGNVEGINRENVHPSFTLNIKIKSKCLFIYLGTTFFKRLNAVKKSLKLYSVDMILLVIENLCIKPNTIGSNRIVKVDGFYEIFFLFFYIKSLTKLVYLQQPYNLVIINTYKKPIATIFMLKIIIHDLDIKYVSLG